MTAKELAGVCELTLLRPTAVAADIDRLSADAQAVGCYGLCVGPCWVAHARAGAGGLRVVTVVGFPLGMNTADTKAYEAQIAVSDGADEIDIVINGCWAQAGDWDRISDELRTIVSAARTIRRDTIVKAIIETGQLTPHQQERAAVAVIAGGADMVKTSTGFGPGGAVPGDVARIRRAIGPGPGIKAAGGIRTREQALELLTAGATRLGTSSKDMLVR